MTNSPGFDWQMTNLNNYVNLYPGSAESKSLGNVTIAPFGSGSGFLGIPGDVTPPFRFIRAAFYQTSTPPQNTAQETVLQCFQILNNFDIPVGIEFPLGQVPANIPSATQWTSATDMTNGIIYYRTMYNSTIRSIDLRQIDFGRIEYHAAPLDKVKRQPIAPVKIESGTQKLQDCRCCSCSASFLFISASTPQVNGMARMNVRMSDAAWHISTPFSPKK